ncbi:Polynucleotide 5'-hydroxyl-kinase NOL9-like Protein [Tribolium castaneum]|uniref:Polynucleotide 5'-hydroxyl-kinase NOL9 n=1 Tax=Tribolium castaneum TaxID=7070 RepID=D6WCR1_TRICA|nr:PREDICTED: polynucleotide 5'-hydroxyl-kinase NOL9 [Tribolium castaneum]EEZ97796.2 Polynucleotide 5'-hydroxyl-kinase NOL9-like Protein [Tribolium castaneum]|eukprot:XP_008190421.1 PREDICTED: polynucleotide 5'-hydroxyl-kinase NOL9 [Tribolium castaneum]
MDKRQSNNQVGRKRKSKSCRKEKKWKCSNATKSHLFKEATFDSSSDENNVSCVKLSDSFKFTMSLDLKPSKSEMDEAIENELFNAEAPTLSEYSFKTVSDEEEDELHNSVVDEFKDESVLDESSVIVSVDSNRVEKNEKKHKVSQPRLENEFGKNVQYCYTSDGIVVVLDKNEIVYIHGLCLLSVLHGQVEILGHIMDKNSGEAKIYSPRGSALLFLKNVTESDVPAPNYLLNLKISTIKLTQHCAVVLCKQLNDSNISFIEKHISQQILQRCDENDHLPRITFHPQEGSWNLIKTDKSWEKIVDTITPHTKMMICGGKGVGKTTFLRYALNRLLMKFKKIRVIDLDPGQAEFTVPGCVSVIEITEPVFGVNYTHLQKAQRSILSNINIAYEPDKYIASIKELLLEKHFEEIPTLVNYMGYTHGMGLNILSAVIIHVQPTDILQISSRDSKKNYKSVLETDIVAEKAQLFVSNLKNLHYNLHQIESKCDENDGWTAEPRQLREMTILAYIREMINSDSVFKTNAPLCRISLNDVSITDLNGNEIPPAAVNACFVALCKQVAEMPHF